MTMTQLENTVAQLMVERPSRSRVFERFGIDYCCGGKKPLSQACQEKGLDLNQVLQALQQEEQQQADPSVRNWASASLTDLANHIEKTHHVYVKQELPRLDMLSAKVADRHGPNHAELHELRQAFVALKEELESHLMKEERVLFPMMRRMDEADELEQSHCGSIDNPISVMLHEHDNAGQLLEKIRALSNDYTPPPDGCNSFRALYDGLKQFEQDLHQHIHKENNILFPKAQRLERLLSK